MIKSSLSLSVPLLFPFTLPGSLAAVHRARGLAGRESLENYFEFATVPACIKFTLDKYAAVGRKQRALQLENCPTRTDTTMQRFEIHQRCAAATVTSNRLLPSISLSLSCETFTRKTSRGKERKRNRIGRLPSE